MDIIGRLPVPFERANGKLVFTIEPSLPDADLRADFTLANREVQAIKEKFGDALPPEMIERLAVLQGYKKAIREIVVQRADAKALLAEDVELPDDKPVVAEPAPVPAPPVADAGPQDQHDQTPVVADFVIDGDAIVDKQGNRYSRVVESVDAQAAQIDADQLAAINASLRPGSTGGGGSAITKVEPSNADVDNAVAQRAPLFAALGGYNQGQDRKGEEIGATQAAHLLHRSASQQSNAPGSQYLFRQDRFAPLQAAFGLERLAGGQPISQPVLDMQAQHAEAMLAAFCGPGELNRDQRVNVNTNRPIATALAAANAPVAIGLGTHEFFRAISLADIYAHWAANPSAPEGVGMWNHSDQDLVDVADPSTWKGYFTLPACPSTVAVSAYFLWRAVRVTVEDQMSRPQYIENITTLMEALLARTAESAMLATFDAWSFQRTVPNTPGYGAMAQLFWGVENVMAWATSAARIDRSAYALVIPEALVNAARIDAFFAQEPVDQVMTRLTDAAGGRLVITQDWGVEGNPMVPMPVQPTPDAANADNGDPIPLIPTVFTIRLVPLEDFAWGSTGVVDYGLNTSPDLRRQNAALFFGEQAEIMYKNGGRPSFTLTLEDVITNGARADRVAPFTRADQVPNNTIPSLLRTTIAADQFEVVSDSIPGS